MSRDEQRFVQALVDSIAALDQQEYGRQRLHLEAMLVRGADPRHAIHRLQFCEKYVLHGPT
jgi:hypothetical protein